MGRPFLLLRISFPGRSIFIQLPPAARVQVRDPEPAGDPAARQGARGGRAAREQAEAHHAMDGDQMMMTDVNRGAIVMCREV